jgi:DNA repair exonuclease SbcCD ATPase subunit
MKKEHTKIVKDVLKNIEESKNELDEITTALQTKLEENAESISNLIDELQSEYDDMSEKVQEGDKGEKLNTTIDKMTEIKDGLESLKDDFEADPFEDIVNTINELWEIE